MSDGFDNSERIEKLEAENEALRSELNQQRFNNKHNLSIDQKIADELEVLGKIKQNRNDLLEMYANKQKENAELLKKLELSEHLVESQTKVTLKLAERNNELERRLIDADDKWREIVKDAAKSQDNKMLRLKSRLHEAEEILKLVMSRNASSLHISIIAQYKEYIELSTKIEL